MSRVMFDTNAVSFLLRRNANIRRRVEAMDARPCVSAVTEGELRYGVAKHPGSKTLQAVIAELLGLFEILPWTSEAAQRYGSLRAELERKGKTLAPLDLMIAAHALEAEASLVTGDRAFSGVPGLQVVDWTLP